MADKKTNSRKLKAMETKKKIYDSALELFKSAGFENISVDSIVETAGISKGTFYVHYESKFSLIADYVNTLDLDYDEYLSSLPLDTKPSAQLTLVTEKIADVISNNIGYDVMKILYSAYLTKTLYTDPLLSYSRKLYQIYKQIIELGVEQGEFRNTLNIDSISKHCILSIRGLTYEWCIRFPNFDLKGEALQHFDLLLSGIKNS